VGIALGRQQLNTYNHHYHYDHHEQHRGPDKSQSQCALCPAQGNWFPSTSNRLETKNKKHHLTADLMPEYSTKNQKGMDKKRGV
jgi:hypothetical protein